MDSSTNRPRPGQNRIIRHNEGIGPPTPEMIEQRAREIAQIEGRSSIDVTEEDRTRAAEEFRDQALVLNSDEDRADIAASRDPGESISDTGHQTPRVKPDDEQENMEREIKEGVREAEHDRMVGGSDD